MWRATLTSSRVMPGGSRARFLPGPARLRSMMSKPEFRNSHEREADRLRSLLAMATTPAMKARLLEQVEEQERLAEEFENFRAAAAEVEA
jgi:hypothetical protein